MDVAELYLSMIRPNGVPVVGECMADGFIGQIQVERWNWNLQNDEEIKKGKDLDSSYEQHRDFLSKQPSAALRQELMQLNNTKARDDLEKRRASADKTFDKDMRAIDKLDVSEKEKQQKRNDLITAHDTERESFRVESETMQKTFDLEYKGLTKELNKQERDYLKELTQGVKKAKDANQQRIEELTKRADEVDAEANKSYEFSFSKRVDFATTQLLNSMKAGDVFPMAVLTIHQRSSNSGMSLVFTVTQLRLLDYAVRAEVSETMTDMKEQWKAEFRSLAYVYKNRKSIEGSDSGSEAAAKLATQGTVRTFAMKKDLPF